MKTGFHFMKKWVCLVLCFLVLLPAVIAIPVSAEAVDLARGKHVAASTRYSQMPAENAVDGNPKTNWRTLSSDTENAWLYVDLGSTQTFNLVRLLVYAPTRMDNFKIQCADKADGPWTDIYTKEQPPSSKWETCRFSDVTARYVRFYAELNKTSTGLYSFEVYHVQSAGDMPLEYVPFQPEVVDAALVAPNVSGTLEYTPYRETGDILPNFSRVGYREGDEPIPEVPVVKTIAAGDLSDHTNLIQSAIDEVSKQPEEQRGAILMKAGRYTVTDTLKLNASGIVLRGEGEGENGTVIYDARATSNTTLHIAGNGGAAAVSGTTSTITDQFVPVGSYEVNVSESDISKYTVGDEVIVKRSPNNLWIQTLGMDQLSAAGGGDWTANSYAISYERKITAIHGTTITLDIPMVVSLDKTYDTTTVAKMTDTGRIAGTAVENLRLESYYDASVTDDENHGWKAVQVQNAKDGWVRNVTAKYYGYSCVSLDGGTKRYTVQNCSYLSPVSEITGGRRYSFAIEGGQLNLIQNCYSQDARHDYVMGSRVAGPNVFLDSIAEESNSVSEPHHRWSTGTLYDNVKQIGEVSMGSFQAINRGTSGTGHGWAGANTVFWNCLSQAVVVYQPQTEQNFAIGVSGIYSGEMIDNNKATALRHANAGYVPQPAPQATDIAGSPMGGTGYMDAAKNTVNPRSIYRAQLSERLYGNAVENVAPNAPVVRMPAPDSSVQEPQNQLTVAGTYDAAADEVIVYVDDIPYEAELSGANGYTFLLKLENAAGYHKIDVTQKKNGVESVRSASRFVNVVGSGKMAYDIEKLMVLDSGGNMNEGAIPQSGAFTVTAFVRQNDLSKNKTTAFVVAYAEDGTMLECVPFHLSFSGKSVLPITATLG